jgi:hypothetical protein
VQQGLNDRTGLARRYHWHSASVRDFTGLGEEAELERIREATRTGRPLGSPDFVNDVVLKIGCALGRLKAGRPRKDAVDELVGCPCHFVTIIS